MPLNITSYNCRGINNESTGIINNLCIQSDVILLQETWLTTNNLVKLKSINTDFDASGIPGIDASNHFINGRPSKGLGFMWRNNLTQFSKFITYDSDRIIGLEICGSNHKLLILNVYLPFEHPDNFEEYLHCLGKINSIIQTSDTNHVIVCGDFNACFSKSFGHELIEFCNENNLFISDKLLMLPTCNGEQPYTYISEAHNTCSWLDHCVSTHSSHVNIYDFNILDNLTFYDHIPITFKYNITFNTGFVNKSANSNDSSKGRCNYLTNWLNVSQEQINSYTIETESLLSNVHIKQGLLCCDLKCTQASHKLYIDNFYNKVVNCLLEAGYNSAGCKNIHDYHVVPGWNDYVKETLCWFQCQQALDM